VLVGILITVVEKVCLGTRANPKGLGGWMWAVWAKMMFVPSHVGDPQTWASRIIMLGCEFGGWGGGAEGVLEQGIVVAASAVYVDRNHPTMLRTPRSLQMPFW